MWSWRRASTLWRTPWTKASLNSVPPSTTGIITGIRLDCSDWYSMSTQNAASSPSLLSSWTSVRPSDYLLLILGLSPGDSRASRTGQMSFYPAASSSSSWGFPRSWQGGREAWPPQCVVIPTPPKWSLQLTSQCGGAAAELFTGALNSKQSEASQPLRGLWWFVLVTTARDRSSEAPPLRKGQVLIDHFQLMNSSIHFLLRAFPAPGCIHLIIYKTTNTTFVGRYIIPEIISINNIVVFLSPFFATDLIIKFILN